MTYDGDFWFGVDEISDWGRLKVNDGKTGEDGNINKDNPPISFHYAPEGFEYYHEKSLKIINYRDLNFCFLSTVIEREIQRNEKQTKLMILEL